MPVILERYEHHAFRRARHLADKNEAGNRETPAVASRREAGARLIAALGKNPPQELQRTGAEAQTFALIIFHDFAARCHRRKLNNRLDQFGTQPTFGFVGSREQRKRLIAQPLMAHIAAQRESPAQQLLAALFLYWYQ